MSAAKKKGSVFDPGLCRCCGTMKKCRVLNEEYQHSGQKEVYADIMMDCFGLLLSHLDGKNSERLICATCVARLREAYAFKKQVLQCEEAFLQMRMMEVDTAPSIETAILPQFQVDVVKVEPDDTDDTPLAELDSTHDDDKDDILKPEEDDTNDSLPLKTLVPHKTRVSVTPHVDRMQAWWMKQHKPNEQTKRLLTKAQQTIRERDQSYMTDSNILTIIEFSYILPFKCRHNNFICYYCGSHFTDPVLLRDHTLTQHSPNKFRVHDHNHMIKIELSKIDCRLCSTKIDDLEEFKKHIVQVHGKKYYYQTKTPVLPFKLNKDDLRCAICNVWFPYFHALNKHMNEHFRNYICETCGLGFVDHHRFQMHQVRHQEGTHPCETCGKLFKSQHNKELHVDRVHKKRGRVYCPKCDVRLMSHPQKLKHLVEVHGEAPQSMPCSVCDKYSKMQCYVCSCKIEENGQYYQLDNMGPDIISMIENNLGREVGENGIMCSHCFDNVLGTISADICHESEEYKLVQFKDPNVCVCCFNSLFMRRSHLLGEGPERDFLSERISPREVPDGALVCHGCWLKIRRTLLQNPSETMTKAEPSTAIQKTMTKAEPSTSIQTNTCVSCLRSLSIRRRHSIPDGPERNAIITKIHPREVFDTRRTLTLHWRKEHLKDYRYECQICGQKFFTRFSLNNHMPVHTGERNFKCKVCEKTYPRLKTLKEHMRIHTNDRRFRCHICGQAFIQNCSLKGHMKSQHPEYG